MHPILLNLGPLTIYSYGFVVALAFTAGILVAVWLGKREKIDVETILDLALYVLIAAIAGARLFYVIEFWRDYLTAPLEIFKIWHGGLVFYGGLIFAVMALILGARAKKLSFWKVLDLAAPATALGYAIGRIGCFLNGCCYGVVCDLPWAVKFPELIGRRHPTQLYASAAGLLIFLTLIFLWRKRKFQGQIFLSGVFLYSIYRFILEFFRVNNRYILGLSESQGISVWLLVFVVIAYYRMAKKKK